MCLQPHHYPSICLLREQRCKWDLHFLWFRIIWFFHLCICAGCPLDVLSCFISKRHRMPEHSFICSFYKNTVFLNRCLRPQNNTNLSTTPVPSMYSVWASSIRARRSPDARRTGSRCSAGASWVWLRTPRRRAAGPRRTWRRRSAAAADLRRNDAPAAACLCPEDLR